MKIYSDKRMLQAGLVGGTISRQSGNMRESANQNMVFQELNIDPSHILHFHQTHSDTLISITSTQEAQAHQTRPLLDADAWLLSPFPSKWGAAIVTADCVPLLIWDDSGTHVALAHCGWRGVVKGLAHKAAQALTTAHPGIPFNAWLGPHIQSCCFEVQEDVSAQFASDCIIHKQGKLFVDLNVEIKRQLTQAGIPAARIQTPYYCTYGDKTNFFSWRRDHEKNLLLSFIYKP